jgi:osmotically-inducible protein OsmY
MSRKYPIIFAALIALGGAAYPLYAQPESQSAKQNEADSEITEKVLQAIADDATLSANGKTVTAVTVNGSVTLRGKVNTVEERRRIESLARGAIGVTRVDNQLVIFPE